MEKLPGTPLAQLWTSMALEARVRVAQRVAEWVDELSRCRFGQLGSLYPSVKGNLGAFQVGRTISFDLYRGRGLQFDINHGPFDSAQQYYQAIISTRKADVNFYAQTEQGKRLLTGEAPGGVGSDEPSPEIEEHPHEDGKIYSLADMHGIPKSCDALSEILPRVFPQEPPGKPCMVMYHHDLSSNNILIDDAGDLVGLVDWEGVMIVPYSLATPYPRVLESVYGRQSSLLKGSRPSLSRTDDSRKIYDEGIDTRQLQEAFRKRLEELRSPWLRTFTERTIFMQEFSEELCGIQFNHPRTLKWIAALDGREDLDLAADKASRH